MPAGICFDKVYQAIARYFIIAPELPVVHYLPKKTLFTNMIEMLVPGVLTFCKRRREIYSLYLRPILRAVSKMHGL